MRSALVFGLMACALVLGVFATVAPAVADDAKVSSYAPAADLDGQVAKYLEDLEKAVESKDEFDGLKVSKISSALVLMSIAASNHDGDSKYKGSAGALFKAAGELAKAKDYDAAKTGVAAVKAAAGASGAAALKWEPAVNLDVIFKHSQTVMNDIKRKTKGARLKSAANETAGGSSVLAIIGQGVAADTSHAKSDAEKAQWVKFSMEMRDAGAAANSAIRSGDAAAVDKAVKKLNQSCEDCHAVFHKEEK